MNEPILLTEHSYANVPPDHTMAGMVTLLNSRMPGVNNLWVNKKFFLVAAWSGVDGRLLGVCVCLRAGKEMKVDRIAVSTKAQKSGGVAQTLLNRARDIAESANCTKITAEVAVHNMRSQRAFIRAGYLPDKFLEGAPEDSIKGPIHMIKFSKVVP